MHAHRSATEVAQSSLVRWTHRSVASTLSVGLLAAGLSVWLRQLTPLWVIADAGHDDQLFVRSASAFAQGSWLGSFDDRTLLKGPGYPLWLAISQRLPVSTLTAGQVLYLVAALVACCALGAGGMRLGWCTLSFAVLAINPAMLGASASRVSRDAFYATISLGLWSTFAWALCRIRDPNRRFFRGSLLLALPAGLLAATYWVTREERVWILPTLAGLCVLVVQWTRRSTPGAGSRRRVAARCLAVVAVMSLVGALPVAMVAERNHRAYDARVVTDYADGAFPRAYARWQAVHAGPTRRYVPVTAAQRQAVYRVSPVAASLTSQLEGPLKVMWVTPGCQALQVCDDYAAGWFAYALRDAAAGVGAFRDAGTEQRFFTTLAEEIATACRSGRLECGRPAPGLAPPVSVWDVSAVVASASEGFRYLMDFSLAEPARSPSSGAPPNYELFRTTLNGLPPTLQEQQAAEARAQEHWPDIRRLAALYRYMSWALLLAGLLGFVVSLRRRESFQLWVLGVAALVAVLCRIGLLAVVDATSFPAVRTSYMLPASTFLLVTGLAGSHLLLQWLSRTPAVQKSWLWWRGRSATTQGAPESSGSVTTRPLGTNTSTGG